MSLQEVSLIAFAIGIGVHVLTSDKTLSEVSKFVGGIGGVLFGLLRLF